MDAANRLKGAIMSALKRVVGIGSSAGGLEALSSALRPLGADLPFAYVVAQHMSPDYESPLVELLSRVTSLEVRMAVDGSALEPGVVTVCPPHRDITVHDGRVRLTDPADSPGPHPTVDVLLTSLAADVGSAAVAVILSGSGSDGAQGVRAIHDAGGVVIAQNAQSAEFDAMPRAAAATGVVDAVIDESELGKVLARLHQLPSTVDHAVAAVSDVGDSGASAPEAQPVDSLIPILEELARVTGIDFAGYKSGTLTRQVERRQAFTGCATLAAYSALIHQREDEARQLSSAILVSVTGFFRDPESWATLAAELLRTWSSGGPGSERRIWVPGCATGEEAYTVAMLASEALGVPADLAKHVKVFATDLREDDLNVGRAGRYTDATVQSIPEPMRERWWRRSGTEWEVSPGLREAIVFARHNVSVDPPFPRLDLVCVRNTLIYFQSALQEQALGMFRFALKPGGLLFLGQSEQVRDTNRNFTVVDAEHRIYRRTDVGVLDMAPVAVTYTPAPHPRAPAQPDRMHDALLSQLLPPSLIADENDEVVDVIGDVSPWCWVSQGPPSTQVTALLRDELRVPVRGLLLRLRHGSLHAVSTHETISDGPVLITARLLEEGSPGLTVISFTEPNEQTDPEVQTVDPSAEIQAVSQELEATQAALHATVEDLSASNEELRALNEELQASSEESQSANEELQASNEELSTLNQELQVRTSDMQRAKTDLENVQASVSAGLVLVDKDLRVTSFSPSAVRVFALIDGDIGRELGSVPTTVPVPDLNAALREAIRPGRAWMTNATGQGMDFLVQVNPYVGDDSAIQGAVVVVTDVTQLAAAQREVIATLERLSSVTDAMDDVVWQRDRSGHFLLLSRGVEKVFGLDRKRVMDNPGLLLTAVHEQDRDRVAVAMSGAGSTWEIQYRIVRPDGQVRWIWESARPMPGPGGARGVTTGFVRDVTDRRALEEIASRRHQVLESFFALQTLSVVLLDAEGRILRPNHAFVRLTGYDPAALIGMPLQSIVVSVGDVDTRAADTTHITRHRLVDKSGDPHWISVERMPLSSNPSDISRGGALHEDAAHTLVAINDLTPHLETTEDLEKQIRYDIQTGVLSRSEFMRRVEQELARARRTKMTCAVLWVDLDGFKEVNDTHGHSSGDFVLSQVAERIAATTRGKDNVGRLGGDEFGILVSDVDGSDGLESACDRLLAAIREPTHDQDCQLYVTASIGVAVAPEDGATADELLHNADTAMYSAKKHKGDHREYFQAAMNERARARGDRRQELAHAVRTKAFTMHYQPMVDLDSGSAIAVEALIRLRRDGQIVCAGEFIDDARETGLLREIGRNVLDEDLQTFSRSPDLADIPVSLNLAVDELEDRELINSVMAWTPPGGMRHLIIEVTEQTLLPEAGQAIDTLLLFQRLGAQICIDDFGTGYSNLGLLEKLRPTKIKIDRSILIRANDEPRSRALLKASVQMVRALQAQPVVEGVETEAQADLLRELGVHAAQGFYFARPMPPAELGDWVAQHPSR